MFFAIVKYIYPVWTVKNIVGAFVFVLRNVSSIFTISTMEINDTGSLGLHG